MVTRRALLSQTLGATGATFLAMPRTACAASEPVTLNIALGGYTFAFLPVLVAQAADLFARHNLKTSLIPTGGGTNTIAALLGGSVDVAAFPISDAILASTKGQHAVSFAPLMTQFASDAVISKTAAAKVGLTQDMPFKERMRRLKGLTLAVSTRGSGTDRLWRYMLSLGGLDPNTDVTLTIIKVDQMYAALKAGQIDGYNATAPANNQSVADGTAVWAARPSQGEVPGLEDFLYCTLAARPSFLKEKPEIAHRIVAALSEANDLIHADPDRAGKVLHDTLLTRMDTSVLQSTVADQRPAFPKHMAMTEKMFEQNIAFMKRFGDQVDGVTFGSVIDTTFLPRSS